MHLQRVTDLESPCFAAAVAILHESIAGETQLPEQRFRALLASGNYQLFVYHQGEDVQGVALVYFSDLLGFAWLDYFAIHSGLRGRGLGSKLFGAIAQSVKEQRPMLNWLLFEVDDNYEVDPGREAQCLRRVRFYRRLGARLLENVLYKFPSAFAAPIRMRLMAYQFQPRATLSADYLKNVVRDIFIHVHGRVNDDQLLRWFQESLPDNIVMK